MNKTALNYLLVFGTGIVIGLSINNFRNKSIETPTIFTQQKSVSTQADKPKMTVEEFLNSPIPSPSSKIYTNSYREDFMHICSSGEVYCTCLYNELHQNYSDEEIISHLKSDYANVLNGNEPMFVNALRACNKIFE